MAIQTISFVALCLYLDFYAPKNNIVKYYEANDTYKNNPFTIKVGLNVIINYCIYLFCLWCTMKNFVNYELNLLNILMNYALSIPLGLLSSIIFYYTHRLLHTKYLYKLHKQHHVYNNPSSFVAIYSSIPDFIFSNCTSIFIPHLIFRTHPYFIIGYVFVGMFDIFINHTSYKFENKLLDNLLGGSQFHFIHHLKYKYNYGLNNKLFDKLHGTYEIN